MAGTGGEGVAAWTNRNDATFASQLAAADSAVLVGGVEAGDLAWVFNEQSIFRATDKTNAALTSSELQAFIDNRKGKTIVIPDGDHMHYGITLSGATYDGTKIACKGRLKLAPDAGASTFGGAWVGLLIKDCSGVELWYRGDGSRLNMTAREQIFNVGIAGGANHRIHSFDCIEIRGDGLYIGQSDWLADSAIPANITIGEFIGQNSAYDGRNALSVISVDGLFIDNFVSLKVGGIIGATTQPGGLDIEPDFGYQICRNIRVNGGYIDSAGTSGFAILGKAQTNDAARDWNCQDIEVALTNVRAGTSGSGLAAAGVLKATGIKLDLTERYVTTKGNGRVIDFCDDVKGKIDCKNVISGVQLGITNELTKFDLDCTVTRYSNAGIQTGKISNGRVSGRVTGSDGVTTFGVECNAYGRGVISQTNVAYSVDCPSDGAARAFRNEPSSPVTFVNVTAENCDWSGYAGFSVTSDATIQYENVKGMDFATAIPSSGSWAVGQIVKNSSPLVDANSMIQLAWVRLTTGSSNVDGVDWQRVYTSVASPAV